MRAEKHNFGVKPVTCHAANADRTSMALSLNDHYVRVYNKNGNGWQEVDTLGEHGQNVTGIDWAPVSNRIVTCGADRNAYVWTYDNNKWNPQLVILRVNRAAVCVKWSPNENKFAVGSSARLISVCYYDAENAFWICKHIKKPIRSTVTCLDWHPNNVLIVSGSSDFKARVFSGYMKEVDNKPSACSWGTKYSFANLMAEFSNDGGGWVHSVSFSPSGEKIAWVGHDSSVTVADSMQSNRLAIIKENFLPFMGITWISENSVVAAGFDCNPFLLTYDQSQGSLSIISKLDIPQAQSVGTVSAMDRFRDLDKKGSSGKEADEVKTRHQNTITQVSVFKGTKEKCMSISTSGADGNVIIWELNSLENSVQTLKI